MSANAIAWADVPPEVLRDDELVEAMKRGIATAFDGWVNRERCALDGHEAREFPAWESPYRLICERCGYSERNEA